MRRALVLALVLATACGGGGATPEVDSSAVVLPAIVAQQRAEDFQKAQRETALLDCQQLLHAAELHYVERNAYPASVEALVAAKMLGGPVKDPWGSAYELRALGNGLRVRSPGPDRQPDTDDDVRCGEPSP